MPITECANVAALLDTITRDVFSTMMEAEVEIGESKEVRLDSPLRDGVVALVGITGPWTGAGRLYCTREAACYFASQFLQMECTEVDRQVLDVLAEMSNMIIGNLKTALEAELGPLNLSVPTVIYGQNYVTHCAAVKSWTVIPVRCGEQHLDVGYFLAPSPVRPTAPLH